jgi:hypothetical protein
MRRKEDVKMQPAVFIARLLGPTFIAIAIGIGLNGPFYTALMAEATHSPTLIYFSGLLALVSGLAVLNVHRSWSGGWRIIITVFGWLWVVAGLIRLILPATTAALALEIYANPIVLLIVAVIVLIIGAVLTYFGYRTAKA